MQVSTVGTIVDGSSVEKEVGMSDEDMTVGAKVGNTLSSSR